MPGRVRRVFDRYAARHLALSQPGPEILDGQGRKIGRVESITLHNDRLVVRGQCRADHMALELGGRRRLGGARSLAGGQGFHMELPQEPGPAVLWFSLDGQSQSLTLPEFSPRRLALARLALWPGFVLAGLASLPSAWRWLRHHDLSARARVKKRLGLGAMVEERALDSATLPADPAPVPDPVPASVTLVLPVYQGFALLPEVLDRIARHTDLPWRLILVEDASPDPQVRPFLRDWAAGRANVTLLENPANLGFIGSVNRGLALAAEAPASAVILLNADAFVPQAWASRLVAPLLADPAVASVTPMSNDAELMSVPVICSPATLTPGAVDVIDAVARRIDPDLAAAPTGVGFCMALSPRFLQSVPALDTAFGRGYGEEVDWCQKTRALGGRHVCLTNLFVEHRGGVSFGAQAKQDLIRRNGMVISARYPGFDAEVQRFIGNDPLLTARLALGLAWAGTAAEAAVPVYLGHTMGGGAEHYLRRRIRSDVRRQGAAVALRVGGEYRWDITLYSSGGTTRGSTNDTALMLRLLQILPRRRVVYSCGVGDPDPVELPELLLQLGAGQRLDVLVHDYLMISPSYTLLDPAGVFRGVPRPGPEGRGHSLQRPDGSRVDLAAWQAEWHRLLRAADHISVFSPSSRELLLTAYPDLAERLQVLPHQGGVAQPRQEVRRGPRPVIGVLGNIAPHKGAALVAALSRQLARSAEADLVLIGNIDPNFSLTPPARMHGSYQPHEISDLAQRYGVGCWLIPSVWPETFSFTTHEALATGLPVICFDLGAQAEAVGRAIAAGAPGAVLPLREGQADLADLVAAVKRLTA